MGTVATVREAMRAPYRADLREVGAADKLRRSSSACTGRRLRSVADRCLLAGLHRVPRHPKPAREEPRSAWLRSIELVALPTHNLPSADLLATGEGCLAATRDGARLPGHSRRQAVVFFGDCLTFLWGEGSR